MLSIKPFTSDLILKALILLEENYQDARKDMTNLPSFNDGKKNLNNQLIALLNRSQYAYALYDQEMFIGFMMGINIPSLWGNADGFYTPLHGHGMKKSYHQEGYKVLYTHLAEKLVKDDIFSHAITIFTSNACMIDTYFHLGFGLRLIDSLKTIESNLIQTNQALNIEKLNKKSAKDFITLSTKLHYYFESSPLFMPQEEEDELKELIDFIETKDHYIYGLYKDNSPIGLIKLSPTGENFITIDKQLMNVVGFYVDETHRHLGYATYLLKSVEAILYKQGYKLLGVDFESFNIKGATFWHKHFKPYTYTLTRRIDETIKKPR